jgi:hypothetical protein
MKPTPLSRPCIGARFDYVRHLEARGPARKSRRGLCQPLVLIFETQCNDMEEYKMETLKWATPHALPWQRVALLLLTIAVTTLSSALSGGYAKVAATAPSVLPAARVPHITGKQAAALAIANSDKVALDIAGWEVGANDFPISNMNSHASLAAMAKHPAVAYNPTNGEYLVAWQGDIDGAGYEIYAQRINAFTGTGVGTDDFCISDMGPDGDYNYAAMWPAIAYNSTNDEYLVVWYGDDNTGGLQNGDYEIFGQRINAATGAEVGTNDFRISSMKEAGTDAWEAWFPDVTYNSANNEYLVVWDGEIDNDGSEIFAQRINAATGAEVGTNDFYVSDMGPDGNNSYGAESAAVVYNPTSNEYLVVWNGKDDLGGGVNYEWEVYGQRLEAATGAEVGTNDFRLSDMGPDWDSYYGTIDPDVAYNSQDNEYLIVWYGDDNTGGLVNDEYEIFGQRINATTGAEVGINDFRISDMGPDGDGDYTAENPSVAYNPNDNEYLVVWQGDDNTGDLVKDEEEIFGQQVDASTGAEVGTNDLRLSDMGPNGDEDYFARHPQVAYSFPGAGYVVVWDGDDTGEWLDEELEIFGQRYALHILDKFVFLPLVTSNH